MDAGLPCREYGRVAGSNSIVFCRFKMVILGISGGEHALDCRTLQEFCQVDQLRILLRAAQLLFPVWPVPSEPRNELTVIREEPIVIIEKAGVCIEMPERSRYLPEHSPVPI